MTLTAEGVREILDYDPANGVFRWISGRLSGSLAGTDQNQGYRHIAIAGRKHLAHRLAWLYIYDEWPAGNLDHINGIRNDNRISNLRIASPSQNAANAKSKGAEIKGVRRTRAGRWEALIMKDYRARFLGTFATKEEASASYRAAAIELFGEFARAA